jgi:hypothetical protein
MRAYCAYRNYVSNNVGPATMPDGIHCHVAAKVHNEIRNKIITNQNQATSKIRLEIYANVSGKHIQKLIKHFDA